MERGCLKKPSLLMFPLPPLPNRHDYHAEVCLQSGGFMPGPLPCSASSPAVSGLRPSLCSLIFTINKISWIPIRDPRFAPGPHVQISGVWMGRVLLRAPDFHAPSVGQEAMVLASLWKLGAMNFSALRKGRREHTKWPRCGDLKNILID